MMWRPWMWLGLLAILATARAGEAPARVESKNEPAALAIRQEGISSEMDELERKILRLIRELQTAEPEQAQRLAVALKQSREKGVNKRMQTIAKLLKGVQLETAAKEQRRVVKDLIAILEVMTAEEDPLDELRKRIEELRRWRRKLRQLSREEWAQKRESEKVSDVDKAQQELAKQIEELERLRREQAAVLKETEAAREKGAADMRPTQQRQQQVREQTEALTKDMAAQAGQKPGEQEGQSPEPGQKALEKAVGHQQNSEAALGKNKSKSAAQAQEKALKAMDEALAQLRQEQKRLASLNKDHPEDMAKEQDGLENQAASLAQAMTASEQSGSQQSRGQQSQSQQKSPGKPSLQKAQKSMQQASKSLRQEQTQDAGQDQTQAHKELEKARKEVEKELARLQEDQQDALLAELIELFQNMLDRQIPVTKATTELETKRPKTWGRAEEVHCSGLANEEKALGARADKAAAMLKENGSPIVFSCAVAGLQQDLGKAQTRLGKQQTDRLTQNLQQEIEKTLRDLIGALEMAQQNPPPPQNGQGQGQQQGQPPLVSDLAELKLLRAMQVRVNQRTKSYAALQEAGAAKQALPTEGKALVARQKSIVELAQKLKERAQSRRQPTPQP